jgi:hypothetical protein
MTSEVNAGLITDLSGWFLRNNNPAVAAGLYDSIIKSLPGLIGYWPGNAFGGGSANTTMLVDQSGNALHLTRNGTTVARSSALINDVEYDGSTGYYSHADAAIFDILGTEGHIGATLRGLTMGAWVKFDNAASGNEYVMSKMGSGTTNLAYGLRRLAAGTIFAEIFNSAAAATPTSTVISDEIIGAGVYTFVLTRWTPSSELLVQVNDVDKTDTSSIIASIANGTALFNIGARSGTSFIDGRVCRSFLCHAAIPDEWRFALYEIGKTLFDV